MVKIVCLGRSKTLESLEILGIPFKKIEKIDNALINELLNYDLIFVEENFYHELKKVLGFDRPLIPLGLLEKKKEILFKEFDKFTIQAVGTKGR